VSLSIQGGKPKAELSETPGRGKSKPSSHGQ